MRDGLYAGEGKCAEAVAEAEHDPGFDEAFVYAVCGLPDRGFELLREAEREAARGKLDLTYLAWMNAALGRRDQAFRCLNRAIDARSIMVVFIRVALELDGIRSDTRHQVRKTKDIVGVGVCLLHATRIDRFCGFRRSAIATSEKSRIATS